MTGRSILDLKAAHKRIKRRNSVRRAARKAAVKKLGLTVAAYEQMVLTQNKCCAICLEKPNQSLCIDHDHQTGAVRALLCKQCNLALGNFKEDPVRMQNAIEYVNKHKGEVI